MDRADRQKARGEGSKEEENTFSRVLPLYPQGWRRTELSVGRLAGKTRMRMFDKHTICVLALILANPTAAANAGLPPETTGGETREQIEDSQKPRQEKEAMRISGQSGIQTWTSAGIAVGTIILAVATVLLTWEVRNTRLAEAEWRTRDAAVRGLEPFIGKYAEPGVVDLHKSGVNLNKRGVHLEVNLHGATLLSREIGYFAGGYLQIEQANELIFELGIAHGLTEEEERDPNQPKFHIGVLRRTGHGEATERMRIRTAGGWRTRTPEREANWAIDLRGWNGSTFETMRTVHLVKYSEYIQPTVYRGLAAKGEPFNQIR